MTSRTRGAFSTHVSVVVNTVDRSESLRRTLGSLRLLTHEPFETIVVVGPDEASFDVVRSFDLNIKVRQCPTRNLSMSRNVGIRAASGQLVAFIDDDAVPEPWWLAKLLAAFSETDVAAAGGPVYDHTGVHPQARYIVADLHGDHRTSVAKVNPTRFLSSPYGLNFVSLLGTNVAFDRQRLTEIGGFDEEFDYYLDETDVGRRLIDQGWIVAALDDARVYHGFLPSGIRSENRVVKDFSSILKNRLYFALRHAAPVLGTAAVVDRFGESVVRWRVGNEWAINEGLIDASSRDRFESSLTIAYDQAFEAARRGPLTRPPEWFVELAGNEPSFVEFAALRPVRRLHVCIVSQQYLPGQIDGIARYSYELARELAARGHVVRIITAGDDVERVDLEDNIWVHRTVSDSTAASSSGDVPDRIWAFARRAYEEVTAADAMHRVDIVHLSNWDSHGCAILESGRFTCVMGLATPLKKVAEVDDRFDLSDPELQRLAELERLGYESCSGFVYWSASTLEDIKAGYAVTFPPESAYIPLGLPDIEGEAVEELRSRPATAAKVLFVGRLEPRKGVDVLLAAAESLLESRSELTFVIVGNDAADASGMTYQSQFEQRVDPVLWRGRVHFLGVIPDDAVVRQYLDCDIFVAPSKYESFGLIALEAMRAGCPVVASDIGGLADIVEDGVSGLLVPPGDSASLRQAIAKLADDPQLRRDMGQAGRQRFLSEFTAERMADCFERFYLKLCSANARTTHPSPGEIQ